MVKLSETDLSARLPALYALREKLAYELDRCASREMAQLARQLRETLGEIAELELAQPKESKLDDLARRRTVRRATAAGQVAASGDSG